MDAALQQLVWQRAAQRCEYCQVPTAVVLLRLDPKTEEVVGITVISFSRHFSFLQGRVPDQGEVAPQEAIKALLAA